MAHNAEAAPNPMINPLGTEPDEEARSQERGYSWILKGQGKALCCISEPLKGASAECESHMLEGTRRIMAPNCSCCRQETRLISDKHADIWQPDSFTVP